MTPDKSDSLKTQSKQLEDAFFLKEDQILIQKLREMRKMEETKEALSRASGITNDKILEKLVKLDIQAEMVAALAAVPLIEVAWADGRVEEKERRAILEGAGSAGFEQDRISYTLLEQWLTHRPGPELLDAWTHYIEGLREVMSEAEIKTLKSDLLGRARAVAEAAGGFLGLTSPISAEEKKMLDKLEKA